mmetsp:Transcript_3665/g.7579  ORF Transcript_3665/g.7579 Transcript_3665/m.7579 type:complete len:212 (-) Transcript_3665:2503-3138(-)
MPQVIPGLDQGALEEGEARVHGGALDEAEEGEDENEVAECVDVGFLPDRVEQVAHGFEKDRNFVLSLQLRARPVDLPQPSHGVLGRVRRRHLGRQPLGDIDDDEQRDGEVDQVPQELPHRLAHVAKHAQDGGRPELGRNHLCCLRHGALRVHACFAFALEACGLLGLSTPLRHHAQHGVLQVVSDVDEHDGDVDENQDLDNDVRVQRTSFQ